MTDLTTSPDLLRPTPGLAVAAPGASSQKIKETADAFEASFLSQMLKPMFEGLSTDGLFGGGQGGQGGGGFGGRQDDPWAGSAGSGFGDDSPPPF